MINEKIIEIYQKKEKADEKITNLINDFLTKAHELVTLSNDFYQIEKTIRLNKISLKDYLLNSEICKYLEETNNVFYTLNDLKRYITTYEKVNNMELTSYTMAINLYEELEKIEKLSIDTSIQDVCEIMEKIPTSKLGLEILETEKDFSKLDRVEKTIKEHLKEHEQTLENVNKSIEKKSNKMFE